jgi:hypothetical protein
VDIKPVLARDYIIKSKTGFCRRVELFYTI